MIVTRSWLNEWIDLEGISTDELCKTFNSIGLEVDRVHSYEIPKKIIVGKVLECEKHPDADKLNVCKVDIGTSIRQIVCGASNVRVGLDVAVATIGAIMPSGLTIKPVKLRGVESEGMICSATEIGLEDAQDGIIELDSSVGNYELGQELLTLESLSDDLIEIELTANRGDCLSIRGVARDLSAAYDRAIKQTNTNVDEDKRIGIGRILSLSHGSDENVNLRYKAVDIKGLSLPFMVRLRLAQMQDSRDTDVESLMLYVTQASGVILRAYSYDFFLSEDDTMAKIALQKDKDGYATIASAKNGVASTVGIIQNAISKVSYDEGKILIEASYIPPEIISKQMQESKIDAGPMYYNTSRGSEPELNEGLNLCLNLLESSSSSSIFGGAIELCDTYDAKIVSISKQEIDEIIGAEIDRVKIGKILRNLGFDITKSSSDNFVITVPRYRHDISHKQDIVEEIVRLVGIDNIKSKPFIFSEEFRLEDDYYAYKKRTTYRAKAAQSGFFETISFVFDEKKVLESYGFETTKDNLELLNPIVNTLDTLRSTLLTGLIKAASQNVKNGIASIRLFEVGSIFDSNRDESLKMAMLFSGAVGKENLSNAGKPKKVDFALFVQKISDIIGEFQLSEHETTHKLSHIYQSAKIIQDEQVVGELFRVHPSVEDSYGLDATYMCELDFAKLSYGLKIAKKSSKYQVSFRDLSIIMPKNMSYERVRDVIQAYSTKELIRFYPVDRYSDEELKKDMSLSIRFVLQSDEKTLQEEDITTAMDSILDALKDKLGVGLR